MATERLNDVWLVGTTWWQGCHELLLRDNCFCKAMAVSQAFIFHFKCYSILHFAVCQLLCWAFLLRYLPACTIPRGQPFAARPQVLNKVIVITCTPQPREMFLHVHQIENKLGATTFSDKIWSVVLFCYISQICIDFVASFCTPNYVCINWKHTTAVLKKNMPWNLLYVAVFLCQCMHYLRACPKWGMIIFRVQICH